MDLRFPMDAQKMIELTPMVTRKALRKRYVELFNQECEVIMAISFWRFLTLYQAFMTGLTQAQILEQTGMANTDLEFLLDEAMGVVSGR